MQKFVIKVGGSNLKNIESLNKVISLVKSYRQPVILVVSAFYGFTDRIIEAVENPEKVAGLIHDLKETHQKALNTYVQDEKIRSKALLLLNDKISKLETLFNDDIRQPAIANEIISYGERISALVIAEILNNNGVPCSAAFPEEIGFVSNSKFYQGTVLLKKTASNLKKNLKPDATYVIPGFYATDGKGRTVLLGRGGSDYSAACIANAIDARFYDVWKDVEGYLSADPKIIANVKKIERLSYLEAAELSYFGAKILHPRTIRPLVEKDIEIRLFNPDKHQKPENESTRISRTSDTSSEVIKSITYSDSIALLKLKGSGVGIKKGILAEVTGALDKAEINIRSVVTSQTAIHFIFQKEDLQAAKNIIDHINKNIDFDTEIEDDIAWIAAVGIGINEKEGVAARIFTALAKENINVRNIVLGASEVAIYFIVNRRDVKKAVIAINNELFN